MNTSRSQNPTFRKELVLAVVSITPIMNDITMRIIPVKKWTKRTTFCRYNEFEYISIDRKLAKFFTC